MTPIMEDRYRLLSMDEMEEFEALDDEEKFYFVQCRCRKCDAEYWVSLEWDAFECRHCGVTWFLAEVLVVGEHEVN